MSSVRDPSSDQPLPGPGHVPIHQVVIDNLDAWVADEAARAVIRDGLAARRELGVSKYGRPLESHNGRDALRDCWEETLDALVYAVQMGREGERAGDVIRSLVSVAARLAVMKACRETGQDGR